ncbi:M15 family metallopeptidase [Luteimicrobium subarcticum]|uniref:D-alanyl-D-alanine carboxypeptidase-like protein n=1 Tax=Luteimicrobium subarcticum TaxID=620910 RepID=A0A2M8WWE0_9MICO|nr:M15 family metallopeptidase [Luteimicrobium subarcticum]PJI95235.1 D-alanyl-D-alanine carboxypeptidase-like protein [Luteimicrobium subarcticum]
MEPTSTSTTLLSRRERREAALLAVQTGEQPVATPAYRDLPNAAARTEGRTAPHTDAAPTQVPAERLGAGHGLGPAAPVIATTSTQFVSRRERREAAGLSGSNPVAPADRVAEHLPVFGAPPVNAGPSRTRNDAPRERVVVRAASVAVPAAAAPSVPGPLCPTHDDVEELIAELEPEIAAHALLVAAQDLEPRPAPAPRELVRHGWIPRVAVLTSLAAATIAVPLTGAARGSEVPTGSGGGPSFLDAMSATDSGIDAPSGVRAMERTSTRETAASRSVERSGLTSCDPDIVPKGGNGQIPTSQLCELWQHGYYLAPDAAVALSAFNDTYRARYGKDLCLVAAYRPLAEQYTLAVTRAGFAAVPGTSNHGLGLAIDMCSSVTGDPGVYQWVRANAPTFGWDNPAWARPGGSGSYEPWHFEFTQDVEARGVS